MSKPKTNPSSDCGCSPGDCEPNPSRRQFFSRGAQSIAAIGVAVQTGSSANAAKPKPSGWLPTGLGQTRDMTVANGLVYVAGDSAVAVFKPSGELVRKIEFNRHGAAGADANGVVQTPFLGLSTDSSMRPCGDTATSAMSLRFSKGSVELVF